MERTAAGPFLSRRELFGAAAAAALPVYLGGSGVPGMLARPPGHPRASTLSYAAFATMVGTRFLVRTAPFRFADLTLLEAEEHGRTRRGPAVTGESFSLIFGGGDGRDAFGPGLYRVAHASMGGFPLSLTPVGMARRGQRYEAVVNRTAPVGR